LDGTPRLARATAALLALQFALMMVPVVVLGRAINWPASLSEPASVVLPMIVQQRGAVAMGYFSYFLSALLLLPIALLVRRVFAQQDGALLTVATWFGALAAVLKLFGISRWLLLMPALANTYVDPAATPATRDTIAVVFDAFNRYAGGIGENLGVMLFAGVWTVLIALVLLRTPRLPRWLGWTGVAAGLVLLAGFVEVFGVDVGGVYLTVSGFGWQLWLLSLAAMLFRARSTV
jgi:hypothetical protein